MNDQMHAKKRSVRFVLALAPALILASAGALAFDQGKELKATTADAQHQGHELHEPAQEVPNKRWPTDQYLRESMSGIEAAFADATRGGSTSKATALTLASTVEEGITNIVKNCKLPKEADAALHVIIHDMASAATQLKTGASIEPALVKLRRALDQYRATFDHQLEAAAHAH